MENTFTLEQITQFTGFTDRTLRSYLHSGILQGEKKDGKWKFTKQQVGEFLINPAVHASIESKGKAILQDFLASSSHHNEACLVLDVSWMSEEVSKISAFFCSAMESKREHGCRFHLFGQDGQGRIYLSGPAFDVAEILAAYKETFAKDQTPPA